MEATRKKRKPFSALSEEKKLVLACFNQFISEGICTDEEKCYLQTLMDYLYGVYPDDVEERIKIFETIKESKLLSRVFEFCDLFFTSNGCEPIWSDMWVNLSTTMTLHFNDIPDTLSQDERRVQGKWPMSATNTERETFGRKFRNAMEDPSFNMDHARKISIMHEKFKFVANRAFGLRDLAVMPNPELNFMPRMLIRLSILYPKVYIIFCIQTSLDFFNLDVPFFFFLNLSL